MLKETLDKLISTPITVTKPQPLTVAMTDYFTKEGLIKHWKERANAKQNSVYDTVFYILLRSIPKDFIGDFCNREMNPEEIQEYVAHAKVYFLKAFRPITNKNKLANGLYSYITLVLTLYMLGWYCTWRQNLIDPYAENFGFKMNDFVYKNLSKLAKELEKDIEFHV